MKPTDKWLIDVNAIASAEGWRHPKTNELLKCVTIDMESLEPELVAEPEPEIETPIVPVTEILLPIEPELPIEKPLVLVADDTVETKPETIKEKSESVKTSKETKKSKK